MKLYNQNIPISSFISTIINEKNKQLKESILLGNINFPKILIYSQRKEENTFKTKSHIDFLNDLNKQKNLLKIREEKLSLEKRVNNADNQLLSIKNYNLSLKRLNYYDRYSSINLNNNILNNDRFINRKIINNRYNSENNSKNKNKSKNSPSVESKKINENIISLPTLGKERKKRKVQNIALKPILIKSFKSNAKVHNHETEEKLEKNAKEFIQKINNNKKRVLEMINKKHEKITLKLKKDIEAIENQRKLKYDEYNNINNLYNNKRYNNFKNIYNINLDTKKEDNKYPSNSSSKKKNKEVNKKNKKYFHYSPYDHNNPQMIKNLSKDLLNFNSELYYNNNIPNIIQYQYLLVPFYNNNIDNNNHNTRNMLYREGPNTEGIDYYENNNQDTINFINGENEGNNISRHNRFEDTNNDNNIIDNSFNKKHLYYFNELKYENKLTDRDKEKENILKNID